MLEWTGERFLPWIKESTIAYEHLHRYAYASTLVKGKRVLDLACGEGYGSKMLSETAVTVTGIDIDETAVDHATQKYGSSKLRFIRGSITSVPVPEDHSFDAIVCFEAIEHIAEQDQLLSEVKRLLTPSGLFIVSTPNKVIYHDESQEENPYHVRELYFEEFEELLRRSFRNATFLGQRIHPGSSIWPIGMGDASNRNGFVEFVINREEAAFQFVAAEDRTPLYFIAVASDSEDSLPRHGSILLDQSDGLIKEKDLVIEEITHNLEDTKASAAEAIQWHEQQVRDREETIASHEQALQWREKQIDDLNEKAEQLNKGLEWRARQVTDLEAAITEKDGALAWREEQVKDLETGKAFWEREAASLNASLQNTRLQLGRASDELAGIHASAGWKLIMRLRRIRDGLLALTGRGKPHA